ncbi:MAG: DUF5320 domain-containing protein [Bacteroidales bacterium]|nr:DUF5320 domain-containing protein [Bacteroidales bacterium]MBN2698504.1 DUF5320 domain-containing protein [Bacteroidales bacterium]
MPGFDRTGPMGTGPRTGRGLGRCNPGKDSQNNNHEELNQPEGLYGRGMARRGMRNRLSGRNAGWGRRFRGGQ